MTRITFAIPFYRGRSYLERAVRSVQAQTLSDWQLLICDDAGPEGDLSDWVASFKDPRCSYVRNRENLGMAGNWNRCLELSRTEWVTLLHADDELLPGYAEVMTRAIDADPGAIAFFCHARIIDEEGRERFSLPDSIKRWLIPSTKEKVDLSGEHGLRVLLRGNFIMCPTLCYRRAAIPRFDPKWKMVLDLDLTSRILMKEGRIAGLPDLAYAYRRHGGNATVRYTQSMLRFEEEVAIYEELEKLARARNWKGAAAVARRKLIIRLNLGYCIVADLLRFNLEGSLQKLRYLLSL